MYVNVKAHSLNEISNGGIIIKCGDEQAGNICRNDLITKIGQNYDVIISKKFNPRVKIVGLDSKYSDTELVDKIKVQNCLDKECEIKVIENKQVENKIFVQVN